MVHASSVSAVRPTGVLARRPSPIIDWSRNNAFSTRACCWSRDVCFHRHRPILFPVLIVRSRTLGRGPRGDTLAVLAGGITPVAPRPRGASRLARARVWRRRPAPSPGVPRSLAGSYLLARARAAANRRAVGVRPPPPPAALTRCRVARGGGARRYAGRQVRPCGAAGGLAPPAPAAPDRRPAGPRRRAVPAHE